MGNTGFTIQFSKWPFGFRHADSRHILDENEQDHAESNSAHIYSVGRTVADQSGNAFPVWRCVRIRYRSIQCVAGKQRSFQSEKTLSVIKEENPCHQSADFLLPDLCWARWDVLPLWQSGIYWRHVFSLLPVCQTSPKISCGFGIHFCRRYPGYSLLFQIGCNAMNLWFLMLYGQFSGSEIFRCISFVFRRICLNWPESILPDWSRSMKSNWLMSMVPNWPRSTGFLKGMRHTRNWR